MSTYVIKDFEDIARMLSDDQIDRFLSELKEIILIQKREIELLGSMGGKIKFGALTWRDDGRAEVDKINYTCGKEIFASKCFNKITE